MTTQVFLKQIVYPAIERQNKTVLSIIDQSGIPAHAWYRYYRGEKQMPLEQFYALCELLDLDGKNVINSLTHSKK